MAGRKPKFDVVDVPLHARGKALYDLLTPTGCDLTQQAVALEAARLADRLDALNAAIESDGVIHLMHYRLRLEDEGVAAVTVSVDAVLAEARQTALAFERTLKAAKAGVDLAKPTGGAAGGRDDLKDRREREQAERARKAK